MKFTSPLLLAFTAALLLSACDGPKKPEGGPAKSDASAPAEPGATDALAEAEAYYKSRPEFFLFKTPADLPPDLVWEDGSDLPELGSPDAKKGGVIHGFVDAFPATLRFIGSDSNGGFRAQMLDDNVIALAMLYPNAPGRFFPGTASAWAVGPDKRTVYFRLDPDVTYSDGVKVTADDYLFHFFFHFAPHHQDFWYHDFYGKTYTSVTKFDDQTIAVTLAVADPYPLEKTAIRPMPRHFYKEYGKDFLTRYQWRFEPTTGAYQVLDKDVERGRSIALTRVKDWWAKDKKFFRHRYNVDRREFTIIRDPDKAFEAFRKGELDIFNLTLPKFWYDKLPDTAPEIQNGWIVKATFYNDIPRPSYGLWLNSAKPPLDNPDVRAGLNYATNWERVIEFYFRGDYQRMRTRHQGYGPYTHPTLAARPFDIPQAEAAFAKAGYTTRGPDGIFVNASGQRLSFTLTNLNPVFNEPLSILKEEAAKAGVEFNLETLDGTTGFKKLREKNHEIGFLAMSHAVEARPRYWEYGHSSNANKPQTNNFTNTADPALDAMIETYDKGTEIPDLIRLAHQMQEREHEIAAFIPGFVTPFYRPGYWRWVKWPADFNVMQSDTAGHYGLHWVDEEERKSTLAARKDNRSLGAQILVFDQYKFKPAANP